MSVNSRKWKRSFTDKNDTVSKSLRIDLNTKREFRTSQREGEGAGEGEREREIHIAG
jgi:hypothetical protein